MASSQTLSRGLTALEFVAFAECAPSIDDIAQRLAVHRSIAYRIVRTLEDHGLVQRNPSGHCVAGVRLAALGRSARPTLRSVAVAELTPVANELEMTCFLVARDGDEALTLESVEPTTTQVHVAYKPGIRHAIDRGAPGVAILAGAPMTDAEGDDVTTARARGWAATAGEVIAGMGSVAVPVPGADAAIATVFLSASQPDVEPIAARLITAAHSISSQIATTQPQDLRAS